MKYRIEQTKEGDSTGDFTITFRIQRWRWYWPVWSYVKVPRLHRGGDLSYYVVEYLTLQEAQLAVHLMKKERLPAEKTVTYIYEGV
ncbi:hypothetical protein CHUUTOTORO_01500 [Serratia phage vB_SmaM-ChuuTotoro]|nr:hypothetical protein CHUUTOTORO_01500 [Serratia phage vB_SmaM-ChuuTotoro]